MCAIAHKLAMPPPTLPNTVTPPPLGDTLRALMTGAGDVSTGPWFLRTMGKLGKLSGITKSAAAIRQITRKFLPMGKNVVVVGGSLVGLELAEFLAARGRRVTLIEEGRQLGIPMAMPRRWTAVRHANELGVTIHRNATLQRISPEFVEFEVGGKTVSTRADMVVVASGVSADAPLAEQLEGKVPEVHVVGDATSVDYIEGAIHTAWAVATKL